MDNIIFNTELITGAKGDKGDTGVSYEVPTGAIIGYDGAGIPDGYEETTEPPIPSGGSGFTMSSTTIASGKASSLNVTETLTAGLYVILFSCATNTGGDAGNITYTGTSGTDYDIKHSYRASNASPAATYPTVAVDFAEIINTTDVTIYLADAQGDGQASYAIIKLDGVASFGNVASETYYRNYRTLDTVTLSSLTITTTNILVLAFGTAKYDDNAYSYPTLVADILNYDYNPFFEQVGHIGIRDGFMLLIPKDQITAVNTYSSDDCTKCIMVVEITPED